jgi:hypothetical protein
VLGELSFPPALDAAPTSRLLHDMSSRLGTFALSFVLVSSLGCASSDEEGGGAPDTNVVADSSVDTNPADVARDTTIDTSSTDTTMVDSTTSDTAADTTTSDTATTDTKPDATRDVVDSGGKPRGQCFTNAHCGAGRTCQPDAPGGICNGCGIDPANCPTSFDTCGTFGSCTRACTDGSECMPGTTCLSTGVCGLKSCSGPSDCPATHACRELSAGGAKFCRRVLCPTGTECPTGTTCKDTELTPAKVCVEDALFFSP